MAKTKINGVYGEAKFDTLTQLVEVKAWIRPRRSRRRSRTAARR